MNPILERLYVLMEKRGVNAKRVTSELNMSASSFTDWKNGKGSPGVEALSKLAPYFGVSLDYLITGKESGAPPRKGNEVRLSRDARERAFLDKLRLLPPDCRERVGTYMDGMLAVLETDSMQRVNA